MAQESMRHAAAALVVSMLVVSPGGARAQTGIPGVLAPGMASELVQEGFEFTEGPVGIAHGALYFSDIRANNRLGRTYYLDQTDKITAVREGTNGAKGLALTRDGELLFGEGVSLSV